MEERRIGDLVLNPKEPQGLKIRWWEISAQRTLRLVENEKNVEERVGSP